MSLTIALSLVLASSPAAPAAPEGVEAPPAATPPARSPEQAMAEYEKRVLGFQDYAVVSTETGMRLNTGLDIFQGKYKRRVENGEFFELVGRPDLAGAYKSKTRLRHGLMLGGLGLAIATVASGAIMTALDRDNLGLSVTTGFIGVPVSIGLVAAGLFTNTQVAPEHEMREMADGYNQRLRTELGLEREPPFTPSPVQQVRITPFVGASSAGLALGGRF